MSHYFLKPIQRLPQYKLLLEDYLRNLNTNSPDYDDTAAALTIVTQAADHANDTIKQTVNHLNSRDHKITVFIPPSLSSGQIPKDVGPSVEARRP